MKVTVSQANNRSSADKNSSLMSIPDNFAFVVRLLKGDKKTVWTQSWLQLNAHRITML